MRKTIIGLLSLTFTAELDAQEQQPPPSAWNVTLGAAAVVVPRYPGSDEYRVLPFPLTQVIYDDRVYLGPSAGGGAGGAVGVYAIRTPRLGVAAEVASRTTVRRHGPMPWRGRPTGTWWPPRGRASVTAPGSSSGRRARREA